MLRERAMLRVQPPVRGRKMISQSRRTIIDDLVNRARHRTLDSVWDRGASSGSTLERMAQWGVAIFGTELLICGVTRRSWGRVALVAGGAGLLACSALGFCSASSSNTTARDAIEPPRARV